MSTIDTEFAKAWGHWCNGKDVLVTYMYLLLAVGRFPTCDAMKQKVNTGGGGKTVHVVFKYLSMKTAVKKGGAG
jgi:hypothetical protein